jgi:AraC family transcriptional regulator
MSAAEWHTGLLRQHGPVEPEGGPFGIRRLRGTPPLISQPALSDDIVCLHLGGAKRVHRWHEGKATVHEVADKSLTIMPRAIENRWRTVGPVDYLHIVLRRDLIEAVAEDHSGDPARIELRDLVGVRQPLIEASFVEMHRLATQGTPIGRLHAESLLTVFTASLIAHSSSATDLVRTDIAMAGQGGLGGWRMRRVIDYMQAHHASNIDLEDLTGLTGLSRAHFYRAFRQSIGATPARYLDAIRAERASALLAGSLSMPEIAAAVGLGSATALATIFRRHFGMSPREYRRAIR